MSLQASGTIKVFGGASDATLVGTVVNYGQIEVPPGPAPPPRRTNPALPRPVSACPRTPTTPANNH